MLTFSLKALDIMAVSIMAFNIMTFIIMTFSIMTFSIMTFSTKAVSITYNSQYNDIEHEVTKHNNIQHGPTIEWSI